uniref:Uncharacterized protein n=1 Tax=Oryza punctata TaxID=4537 RepID=A0A0E0MLZ5_ORYPU
MTSLLSNFVAMQSRAWAVDQLDAEVADDMVPMKLAKPVVVAITLPQWRWWQRSRDVGGAVVLAVPVLLGGEPEQLPAH